MFSRMTDKTVFFEIFIEEDYDYDEEYYDDYYDDELPPGADKPKAGAWKSDLGEDEAVAGMLKEKVDDMVKKMTKMKVNLKT